jgi:hypothetical protein
LTLRTSLHVQRFSQPDSFQAPFALLVVLVREVSHVGAQRIRNAPQWRRLGVRTRLRRYRAANVLNRLETLTYRGDGDHDLALIREHLGEFFRDLRSRLAGDPLPYAWVPEWHPSGHRLHAHFAVGRFIKHGMIAQAWHAPSSRAPLCPPAGSAPPRQSPTPSQTTPPGATTNPHPSGGRSGG